MAAGKIYGLPVAGTMAHSFVEACVSEAAAFRSFSEVFPDTVLLVDTYDTIEGVKKVIALAHQRGKDFKVRAVRLDSGDLDKLSREARHILDEAGLNDVQIVASGGLDETKIDDLTSRDAPIDIFGVGTDMAVSSDAPALDIAYKLTEYAGVGRMKLSTGKRSLPGRKQVFRQFRDGVATRDIIARYSEVYAASHYCGRSCFPAAASGLKRSNFRKSALMRRRRSLRFRRTCERSDRMKRASTWRSVTNFPSMSEKRARG